MTETVCIRCGKTRIFSRRWEEKTDRKGQVIIHEETVCPDPECQNIVDQHFADMRIRRDGSEKKNLVIGEAPKT